MGNYQIDYQNVFKVNGDKISVKRALELIIQAGNIAMKYYNSKNYTIEDKGAKDLPPSCSPRQLVTNADKEVQAYLEKTLTEFTPNIPFLGEEGKKNLTHMEGAQWQCDPIDGTRFFVGKSELKSTGEEHLEGQFTIHLALINEKGEPVWGGVYAPAYGELFFNDAHDSAVFVKFNDNNNEIRSLASIKEGLTFKRDEDGLHRIGKSEDKVSLQDLEKVFSFGTPKSDGSMLKAIGVAAGQKDFNFYDRFALFEWDSSAAQAILKAVGGDILKIRLDLHTGEEVSSPLHTGHERAINYQNPFKPAYSGGVFHTQPKEPWQFLKIRGRRNR